MSASGVLAAAQRVKHFDSEPAMADYGDADRAAYPCCCQNRLRKRGAVLADRDCCSYRFRGLMNRALPSLPFQDFELFSLRPFRRGIGGGSAQNGEVR